MTFYFLNLLFCILLNEIICVKGSLNESNILILNNNSFQDAVKQYKNLFVFMYIEDSQESQTAVPLIDNLGIELSKRNIKATVAKLPLGYDNTLLAAYDVEEVSAFMAIMDHGERFVEFTDSLKDLSKLLLFVERKQEPPVKEIDDADLLRAVIENSLCISVGFFENFTTPEYEEYRSNADWYYLCDHFSSKSPALFKYFKVEDKIPTIKMFKGCIHDSVDFPRQLPLQGMHILKFFMVATEPDVSPYGINWLMKRTFKDPQFSLMLFVKKDDAKKQFYLDILEKYARRYREEINMAYAEVDGNEDIGSLLYTFDIKVTDAPVLRAIELSNRYGNNTRKYKPKRKTINDDSVRRFIGEVYYKQLQPYLISDKIPDNWNTGPIITVVGDNFKNITEDTSKTVMIVFYDEGKKYDTLIRGQITELSTDLRKEGRTDVIIGKSNYISNEYFGWHPDKFPSIILFPKGENVKGIIYAMELSYEDLRLFIESDGKINKIEERNESMIKPDVKIKTTENDDEGEIVEIEEDLKTQRTEL